MKKLVLILVVVLTLIGCSEDALITYQEASIKTETIEKAKSKLEIDVKLELSNSTEETKELENLLSDVHYESSSAFDRKSNEQIVRQFIGTPGFGFDTVFYNEEGKEYVKIPFAGKYLMLEDIFEINGFNPEVYDEMPISLETYDKLKIAWLETAGKEDVVNLGNDVIDTPEGEVKVKKFVINLSNSQIKGFLNQGLNIIEKDPIIREKMKDYPMFYIQEGKLIARNDIEIDFDLMIEGIRNLINDLVVEEFSMVTFIDVDNYIIESEYHIDLSFAGFLGEYFKSLKVDTFYQLYDLHEPISFEFPVVDDTNITTIKELQEEFNIDINMN